MGFGFTLKHRLEFHPPSTMAGIALLRVGVSVSTFLLGFCVCTKCFCFDFFVGVLCLFEGFVGACVFFFYVIWGLVLEHLMFILDFGSHFIWMFGRDLLRIFVWFHFYGLFGCSI
ncbi:hypothetical protein Hanom_Chr03g00269011 [Helianthus anomalus]